jgi:hypothetical protein
MYAKGISSQGKGITGYVKEKKNKGIPESE